MSEAVDESLRDFCKDTFGCNIISNYSSAEVGYIALQCPDSNNFHVMSEVNYVEVINDEGKACTAGELGKVVVTPLHNFAMPLFRYEIGDQVEMGQPCSCGRGLPTIKRIIGRLENYLILKNGDKKQLDFSHYRLSAIRSIIEFQLAQISFEKLELRLVISKALIDDELNIINTMMQKSFSKNFEYEIIFCEKIARTMSGKLMQFVSEIKT
jgi:phenylacetate-CoA ligase